MSRIGTRRHEHSASAASRRTDLEVLNDVDTIAVVPSADDDLIAAPPGSTVVLDGSAPPSGRRRRGRGPIFYGSCAWLALVVVCAAVADLLPLPDPAEPNAGPLRLGPLRDAAHLLGTDQLGRDMLARCIYGARVSLIVGFSAVALGMVVGGVIGLAAGFYRGRLELLLMGAMDVLLAFPALVLALAIVTFRGQSLFNVVLAIGVLSIAPLARLVRANTLVHAQREYILAARTLGARNGRIMFKEILPNVVPPSLSFGLIGVAVAIVAEGSLAFLGLSVRPPSPTWGGMINEGRIALGTDPMISFTPAFVMFLTVLSLNFVGDVLRSRFDVREVRL